MPILSSCCGIKQYKAQKILLPKGRHPLNVGLLEISWDKIITNTLQLRAFSPIKEHLVQFSRSAVSNSAIPWTAPCQASLSITNSHSLLKLMSIKSVMPSNHLTLCRPLLLLTSIFPNIRVFSNESVLCISSVQFSSVAQLCPTLCDPMDCSMPGLPVHHQLPVFTQTHVHCQ